MKTKLISSNVTSVGYGAKRENTAIYEYECPCGKGKIIEEHDNIPGFRQHDVHIRCEECKNKYTLDTSKGVSNWELIDKAM